MLKHVLVPLDGSPLAEEALKDAKNVLCADGKITLLMAVDVMAMGARSLYPLPIGIPMGDFGALQKDMIAQATNYLENIARSLRAERVEVAIAAIVGDPADVIVETAGQKCVDAIVMSTHGRSGLNRWLFGSVAGRVLSAASCPIFVIPSKAKQQEFEANAAEINYG